MACRRRTTLLAAVLAAALAVVTCQECVPATTVSSEGEYCGAFRTLFDGPVSISQAASVRAHNASGYPGAFIVGGFTGNPSYDGRTRDVWFMPDGPDAVYDGEFVLVSSTANGLPLIAGHVLLAPTTTKLLAIGGGNSGASATPETDTVYMSVDGGVTWTDVLANGLPALVFHGGACIDGTCYVLDSVTSGTNTLYEASDASYAVWTQHAAAIPFGPRRGYMMTAVGTKLIVAGGTMDDPGATGSGPAPRIYHEDVYVIDVAAGTPTWTELASGSVFGRTDAAMVTVDGRVFFGFGGIASSSGPGLVTLSDVLELNPTDGTHVRHVSCSGSSYGRELATFVPFRLTTNDGFVLAVIGGNAGKDTVVEDNLVAFENMPCHFNNQLCNCEQGSTCSYTSGAGYSCSCGACSYVPGTTLYSTCDNVATHYDLQQCSGLPPLIESVAVTQVAAQDYEAVVTLGTAGDVSCRLRTNTGVVPHPTTVKGEGVLASDRPKGVSTIVFPRWEGATDQPLVADCLLVYSNGASTPDDLDSPVVTSAPIVAATPPELGFTVTQTGLHNVSVTANMTEAGTVFCVFRPVGNAAPLAGPMRATNDLEFAISAGTAITKWVSYEGTSGRRWLDCTSKSALGVAGSVGSQRFDFDNSAPVFTIHEAKQDSEKVEIKVESAESGTVHCAVLYADAVQPSSSALLNGTYAASASAIMSGPALEEYEMKISGLFRVRIMSFKVFCASIDAIGNVGPVVASSAFPFDGVQPIVSTVTATQVGLSLRVSVTANEAGEVKCTALNKTDPAITNPSAVGDDPLETEADALSPGTTTLDIPLVFSGIKVAYCTFEDDGGNKADVVASNDVEFDADPPELSVPSCSQQSSTLASIAYTSNEEGKLHCVVAANAAAVGQLSATDVQNNGVAAAVGSATVSFGFTGTSGTRVAVCGLADAEGNMASQVSCGPFAVDAVPPTLGITSVFQQSPTHVHVEVSVDEVSQVWCKATLGSSSSVSTSTVQSTGVSMSNVSSSATLLVPIATQSTGSQAQFSNKANCFAVDAMGNTGVVVESGIVSIDGEAPTISELTAGQASGVVSVSGDISEATVAEVWCAVKAASDTAPATFDDVVSGGLRVSTSAKASFSFTDLPVGSEGQKVVYCAALDQVGNKGDPAASAFTYDATPPELSQVAAVQSSPFSATVSGQVSSGSTVYCVVAPSSSTPSVTAIKSGTSVNLGAAGSFSLTIPVDTLEGKQVYCIADDGVSAPSSVSAQPVSKDGSADDSWVLWVVLAAVFVVVVIAVGVGYKKWGGGKASTPKPAPVPTNTDVEAGIGKKPQPVAGSSVPAHVRAASDAAANAQGVVNSFSQFSQDLGSKMSNNSNPPVGGSRSMSSARTKKSDPSIGSFLDGDESWTISADQITVDERIGGGAFGMVFRGTYAGSTVALKQLFADIANPAQLNELRAEATLLSQLHHPNVLHFYGVCPRGRDIYLVTEFCPASVLGYLMDQHADHSLGMILALALQVARGMRYLHSKGVIHRDLKPDNLLLTAAGQVRVCDFGLARVQASHSMTVNKGTPAYMAPETMTLTADAHGKQYTNAVDVYSYGVLLWTMATRRQPFGHVDNPFAIPALVVNGVRPPMPAEMPPRLASLITSCWSGSPRLRPSFAQVEGVLQDPEVLSSQPPVASPSYDNDHAQAATKRSAASLPAAEPGFGGATGQVPETPVSHGTPSYGGDSAGTGALGVAISSATTATVGGDSAGGIGGGDGAGAGAGAGAGSGAGADDGGDDLTTAAAVKPPAPPVQGATLDGTANPAPPAVPTVGASSTTFSAMHVANVNPHNVDSASRPYAAVQQDSDGSAAGAAPQASSGDPHT